MLPRAHKAAAARPQLGALLGVSFARSAAAVFFVLKTHTQSSYTTKKNSCTDCLKPVHEAMLSDCATTNTAGEARGAAARPAGAVVKIPPHSGEQTAQALATSCDAS